MHETHDITLPQFETQVSLTIYVAVSNVLKSPLTMVGESTNSTDFKKFLRLILDKRTDKLSGKPLHLVMDGK